jgi:hypothetical protein
LAFLAVTLAFVHFTLNFAVKTLAVTLSPSLPSLTLFLQLVNIDTYQLNDIYWLANDDTWPNY